MIASGDYGTEEDVLQIIEEKVRVGYPQVRQHPDNPRNPHLRQYWVSVKTEGTRQHSLQHINELRAEGEVGNEAGSCLAFQRLLEAKQPFFMHSKLANCQSFGKPSNQYSNWPAWLHSRKHKHVKHNAIGGQAGALAGPGGVFDRATFASEARVDPFHHQLPGFGLLGLPAPAPAAPLAADPAPPADPKPDPPKPDPKPPKPNRRKTDVMERKVEAQSLHTILADWAQTLVQSLGVAKQLCVKMEDVPCCKDLLRCMVECSTAMQKSHKAFGALGHNPMVEDAEGVVEAAKPHLLECRKLMRQAVVPSLGVACSAYLDWAERRRHCGCTLYANNSPQ
jgi:hypothetical protein